MTAGTEAPGPLQSTAVSTASLTVPGPRGRGGHLLPLAAAVVIGCLVPLVIKGPYGFGIANQALVYVILALGFYFVFALGGQFSLGHNAFFAVGGFSGAWMGQHSGFWLALGFSVLATAASAAAFKLLLLRTSAVYFAIATLALSEIAGILWANWKAFTGGFSGEPVNGLPTFLSFKATTPVKVYWVLLGITLLAVLLAVLLEQSPVRRRFLAARDIPLVATTFGLPTRRMELLSFTLGGAYAGAAGCLLAYASGFVSPDSFTIDIALLVLLMVLLGGMSSLWGAVIGAVFLTWLPNGLRSVTTHSDLVYAVLILVVILAFPQGLIGLLRLVGSRIGRDTRAR